MIDLARRTSVEPMQFHGPGWQMDTPTDGFQLWAPQDGSVPDPFNYAELQRSYNPDWQARGHWAASWHERPAEDAEPDPFHPGGFWKGQSASEVLANFPPEVRRLFESALP